MERRIVSCTILSKTANNRRGRKCFSKGYERCKSCQRKKIYVKTRGNRVKLYTGKCKEFRISFTSDCDFSPVVIGEECIKLVKNAKVLGVTISDDLSWNAHITEVTKKAAKRLYFLVQLKRARVPRKDLCLFYITCVRSVIDYAAPVFHHALPASLECKKAKDHNEEGLLGTFWLEDYLLRPSLSIELGEYLFLGKTS